MFTRLMECQPKAGKREEITNKVRNEMLVILQKQPGFVDLIALRDTQDERLIYLTFWKSKEEAELYHDDSYDQVVNLLKPLLSSVSLPETFKVDVSTIHRIAIGKAA